MRSMMHVILAGPPGGEPVDQDQFARELAILDRFAALANNDEWKALIRRETKRQQEELEASIQSLADERAKIDEHRAIQEAHLLTLADQLQKKAEAREQTVESAAQAKLLAAEQREAQAAEAKADYEARIEQMKQF